MPETKDRLRPHSVAAAAQLLELWLTGRAVLDEVEVDNCMHMVQVLLQRCVARLDWLDRKVVNDDYPGDCE